MAFTLLSRYDPRTNIVYATFDGVLIYEAEINSLFTQLGEQLRPLDRPAYVVINCDSWRVDTALMRGYGAALRAFSQASQACLACYSADIYARMNLRLAAVIGGATPNLFNTPAEAVNFIQGQQLAAAVIVPPPPWEVPQPSPHSPH